MEYKDVVKEAIYVTKHGSHAYGLNVETSDLDIKGVFIAPREYYFSYFKHVEQVEDPKNDGVIYELRKFFKLAADCNPNIIEVLFTDEEDILNLHHYGKVLRANRNLFLSQKAKFTFSGYAVAQLKRINTRYKWLSKPPVEEPKRENYGLPKEQILAKSQIELLENNNTGYSSEVTELIKKEYAFIQKYKEWQNYNEWRKNRNEKRAELEAKASYDTKHGMHLVRLMRMGEEILKEGKVIVKRPDREELLAIRGGAWKYDDLVKWAEEKDQELTELYDSKKSPLPHHPDTKALDSLCIEMAEGYHEYGY
jgi:predicted nucleotidyltransferase